jgi:hypothetical protein
MMADETSEHTDPVEDAPIDWEARESELLALKKSELIDIAADYGLETDGTKADLTARIITEEQDAQLDEDLPDLDDPVEDEDGESEDVALGDAMADEVADEVAEVSGEDAAAAAKAEEAARVKAGADHERAHAMGVSATPGTTVTLDSDRLITPAKPKEAWDALAKNIQADIESNVSDLFENAADAVVYAAEFAQTLAKYKYKLATARDTFQKRMYEQNLRHLEAQMATEAARKKLKLVKGGDVLLERILKMTIKAVAGAALGALI